VRTSARPQLSVSLSTRSRQYVRTPALAQASTCLAAYRIDYHALMRVLTYASIVAHVAGARELDQGSAVVASDGPRVERGSWWGGSGRTHVRKEVVMRVIAFASRKGGVGKTTLVGHLAVEAGTQGAGPVALVDTDPQGSLAAWWNERKAEAPLFVRVELSALERQLLELHNHGIKLVMIDTPPSVDHIEKVIEVADLVLIPVRPSPHDLRAIAATVDLVESTDRRMAFIVNGASVNSRISTEAVMALAEHGRVAPVIVHQRVNFAASMTDGRTAGEVEANSKAAEEIKQLWNYVDKLVSGTTRRKNTNGKDDTVRRRVDRS
jgi:chromosome partitioning protein